MTTRTSCQGAELDYSSTCGRASSSARSFAATLYRCPNPPAARTSLAIAL